jgi:hypothetical protein
MMHNVSFRLRLGNTPTFIGAGVGLGLTGVLGSGCLTKTLAVLLHVLGVWTQRFSLRRTVAQSTICVNFLVRSEHCT